MIKMIHIMHLAEEPFEWIKEGKKVIEVRLFDKKRRKIDIGDVIMFKNLESESESIKVRVKALLRFKNFLDLFELIPKQLLGHNGLSIEQQVARMRKYYSKEKEEKYGVLGVWFEVIK